MAQRPELEILNGALAGRRYKVTADGLRLGRSSSNDIHVADEQLSRNHCLFEAVGDDGIRLTDLASANGTLVNGKLMGYEPVTLNPGDVIEVGETQVRVVSDEPLPGLAVDLGLGDEGKGERGPRRRRSPFANVLWAFVVLVAAAAVYVVLTAPAEKAAESAPKPVSDENPPIKEVVYEKVEATSERIFRYELTFSEAGVLKVEVDDLPKESRHLTKQKQLDEKSLAELNDILAFRVMREIDREYVGAESEPPVLNSVALKVVYEGRVRRVKVVNTQEPEALRTLRGRLETFSKNELGVWALQYSRDKLVSLAENAIALGFSKWEEREVNNGNLFASAKAYREALFYLETVNPKPACGEKAREGLDRSTAELEKRFREQRFLADRAINMQNWDDARRELLVLIEMIPDRGDPRNSEARDKLVDVEKRIKKGDL